MVGTALDTELGRIAEVVLYKGAAKAPLLVRMEKFTQETTMAAPGQAVNLDPSLLKGQVQSLASQGYRIIALAAGKVALGPQEVFSERHLNGVSQGLPPPGRNIAWGLRS